MRLHTMFVIPNVLLTNACSRIAKGPLWVVNRRWHLDFERLLYGNFLVMVGKFFYFEFSSFHRP